MMFAIISLAEDIMQATSSFRRHGLPLKLSCDGPGVQHWSFLFIPLRAISIAIIPILSILTNYYRRHYYY